MTPQGFPLQIIDDDDAEYLVVGWRDYTPNFRPVVIPIKGSHAAAVTLPEGTAWRIKTRALPSHT